MTWNSAPRARSLIAAAHIVSRAARVAAGERSSANGMRGLEKGWWLPDLGDTRASTAATRAYTDAVIYIAREPKTFFICDLEVSVGEFCAAPLRWLLAIAC